LGGIWEIIFAVSAALDGWRSLSAGASSSSSKGTGECGLRAARARRDSSQRAWSAALSSSRIRSEEVGVEAADARDLVAQALLGEDLGDAVFGHPRLVAVPQAVRR
jgi:hypothetical protein